MSDKPDDMLKRRMESLAKARADYLQKPKAPPPPVKRSPIHQDAIDQFNNAPQDIRDFIKDAYDCGLISGLRDVKISRNLDDFHEIKDGTGFVKNSGASTARNQYAGKKKANP